MQIKHCFLATILLLISMFSLADIKPAMKKDSADISISGGSIRAMPPGQTTTAAFFTLNNNSNNALTLEKLSSNIAERVEIHSTEEHNGSLQMRKRDYIAIAAGETTVFAPGQDHIMFIGLKKPLKDGDNVDLNLCFGDFCKHLTLKAVSVLAESGHHHHHQ